MVGSPSLVRSHILGVFSRRHETRYRENRLAVAKHAPDFSNSFSFPCAHANPSFLSFSLLFFLLFSHSPPLSRGSSFAIFPFFPFFFFPPETSWSIRFHPFRQFSHEFLRARATTCVQWVFRKGKEKMYRSIPNGCLIIFLEADKTIHGYVY